MLTKLTSAVAVIGLISATIASAQGAGNQIGLADWVNPDATGRAPASGTLRQLRGGARVVQRERVDTNQVGAADFIFVNDSRLLVGPACSVVLDERFYDPRLDVEVKEFTLETRSRCIAKADNVDARDPADRIVLQTVYGVLAIESGAATIGLADNSALASNDESQPLLAERAGSEIAFIVAATDMRSNGRIRFGPVSIRRAGFIAGVDANGRFFGPERADPAVLAGLDARLAGAVQVTAAPSFDGDWELGDVRQIDTRERSAVAPPQNCFGSACERRPDVDADDDFPDIDGLFPGVDGGDVVLPGDE